MVVYVWKITCKSKSLMCMGNMTHLNICSSCEFQVNSEWELVRLVEQWLRCGPTEITADPSKHLRPILRHIRVTEIVRDGEEDHPPDELRPDIKTYITEEVRVYKTDPKSYRITHPVQATFVVLLMWWSRLAHMTVFRPCSSACLCLMLLWRMRDLEEWNRCGRRSTFRSCATLRFSFLCCAFESFQRAASTISCT